MIFNILQGVEWSSGWLAVIFSILGSVITWIISDVRSKSRLSYMEEKVEEVKGQLVNGFNFNRESIDKLNDEAVRCTVTQEQFYKELTRVDSTKASKELVDSFRIEISTLKLDMDKRFDRLERLIQEKVK